MGATGFTMSRKWLIDNQGLFFMAPAMILFVVFVLYPIFYIFDASMYDWDGINDAIFVGFQNYIEMFTDDRSFSSGNPQFYVLDIPNYLSADVPRLHPRFYSDLGRTFSKCLPRYLFHARYHFAGGAGHHLAADLCALRRIAGGCSIGRVARAS